MHKSCHLSSAICVVAGPVWWVWDVWILVGGTDSRILLHAALANNSPEERMHVDVHLWRLVLPGDREYQVFDAARRSVSRCLAAIGLEA